MDLFFNFYLEKLQSKKGNDRRDSSNNNDPAVDFSAETFFSKKQVCKKKEKR